MDAVQIELLSNDSKSIAQIAHWYFATWRDLYAPLTEDEVAQTIATRTQREHAPLSLVALVGMQLVGVVALKEHDFPTRMDLSPWLAGLYVDRPWRRRGIGAQLVRALEQKAASIGITQLYLYTPDAEDFYRRLGWQWRESLPFKQRLVSIMEKQLDPL